MKEFTVITTVEFTDIFGGYDDFDKKDYLVDFEAWLDNFNFDRMEIKKTKVFVREAEDESAE